MKEILLGLADKQRNETFLMLRLRGSNVDTYDFENVLTNDDRYSSEDVLDIVGKAAYRADKINFVLDGLKIPFKHHGCYCHTIDELSMVLDTPSLLQKTQFWLHMEPIDTETVLRLREKDIPNPITVETLLPTVKL